MTFAEKIKLYRKQMKMTQQAFAKHLGVSFATLNRWEKGHHEPSGLALSSLELKLGVKL